MTVSAAQLTGNPGVVPALAQLTYAPVPIGFGSPVFVGLEAKQIFKSVVISGSFQPGTPTPVEARLPLPAGCTVGTYNGLSKTWVVGKYVRNVSSASTIKQGVILATTGQTYLTFGVDDFTTAANPLVNRNGNDIAVANDVISFDGDIEIPCAEFQLAGGYVSQGAGPAKTDRYGLQAPRSAQMPLTVTASGWTTTRAVGVAYQDINGVWRATINISGSVSSAPRAAFSVSVAGTIFKSGISAQAMAGNLDSNVNGYVSAYAASGSGTLAIGHASGTTTAYYWAGDLELDSKPTWAV